MWTSIKGTWLPLFIALIACDENFFALDNQKPLIIITASYNNASWTKQYVKSLAQQTYQNWMVIYIDDHSTDDTVILMQQLISEYQLESHFILVQNTERMGHLCNQYSAIHSCPQDTIIVILDGDDWFADAQALQIINAAYADGNTWLTYGQFWYLAKNKKGLCKPIPDHVIAANTIRQISWRTSHPRTFYAGLFRLIALEDLLYEGYFYPKCADVATMFPMIEMAGKHIQFIPEILYVYNDSNPISYHHDPTQQRALESYLRARPRYGPLKEKPW